MLIKYTDGEAKELIKPCIQGVRMKGKEGQLFSLNPKRVWILSTIIFETDKIQSEEKQMRMNSTQSCSFIFF